MHCHTDMYYKLILSLIKHPPQLIQNRQGTCRTIRLERFPERAEGTIPVLDTSLFSMSDVLFNAFHSVLCNPLIIISSNLFGKQSPW